MRRASVRRRVGRQRIGIRQVRRRAERITKRLSRLPPLIRRVIEVVGASTARRLTLVHLSKVVNRSPSHLNVIFCRATGLTVHEYAIFLRMTQAARAIEQGGKIEAVAMSVGYRSKKNFYRQFKAWFGMNPTDFRVVSRSSTES